MIVKLARGEAQVANVIEIASSTPMRVTSREAITTFSLIRAATKVVKKLVTNTGAVKWRKPSMPGSPDPVLVIMAGYSVHFDALTPGLGAELRVTYGPGLPKISPDGLEISVFVRAHSQSDPVEIYRAPVKTGDQWKDVWLALPTTGEPLELCVKCGAGPDHDPTADWLAIAELVLADRKAYSLHRARANKVMRTQNEIRHFSRSYRQPMFQKKAGRNAFAHAQSLIQAAQIDEPINFALRARELCRDHQLQILTVCCGAARVEEGLFQGVAVKPHITLVDINGDLLDMAADRIKEVADYSIIVGDANEIKLPQKQYDVAICVAGLHHIVELEHLFKQIAGCLKPDGEFWSIGEYVGRNGARLWPESYEVADGIFSSLPEKYRRNNVSVKDPKAIDEHLSNVDCSLHSFEGIRAEDIEMSIKDYFEPVKVNRWSTIVWRVIGPAYVDNYDLDDPDDLKLVEEIAQKDIECFKSGRLKPVALRGIYRAI